MKRQIWRIAWDMWSHRNDFLHNILHSIHPQDTINIDSELRYELDKGLDTLPNEYNQLFNGRLDLKMKMRSRLKIEWLFNVWSARENMILPIWL